MHVQVTVEEQFFHGIPDKFNTPNDRREVKARPIYLDPSRMTDMNPASIELAVKKILTARGIEWRERVGGSSTIVRRVLDWEVK